MFFGPDRCPGPVVLMTRPGVGPGVCWDRTGVCRTGPELDPDRPGVCRTGVVDPDRSGVCRPGVATARTGPVSRPGVFCLARTGVTRCVLDRTGVPARCFWWTRTGLARTDEFCDVFAKDPDRPGPE